jgi:hypothetical protein
MKRSQPGSQAETTKSRSVWRTSVEDLFAFIGGFAPNRCEQPLIGVFRQRFFSQSFQSAFHLHEYSRLILNKMHFIPADFERVQQAYVI